MKIVTSIITQYQADDGTQFMTKEMCIAHDQLTQLRTVIEAEWPTHLSRDADTIALMMIATWDRLADAMEVQSEDLISNGPALEEPVEEEATLDEDEYDIKAKATTYAYDWAKEYTQIGVGCRTFSANYREAYARKLAELEYEYERTATRDGILADIVHRANLTADAYRDAHGGTAAKWSDIFRQAYAKEMSLVQNQLDSLL